MRSPLDELSDDERVQKKFVPLGELISVSVDYYRYVLAVISALSERKNFNFSVSCYVRVSRIFTTQSSGQGNHGCPRNATVGTFQNVLCCKPVNVIKVVCCKVLQLLLFT